MKKLVGVEALFVLAGSTLFFGSHDGMPVRMQQELLFDTLVFGAMFLLCIFLVCYHPARGAIPVSASASDMPIGKVDGYVYLIKGERGFYKIGHTKNPKDRMKTFSVKLPYQVEYLHLIPCQNRQKAELYLHTLFASRRGQGEWFSLTPQDVAVICSLKSL